MGPRKSKMKWTLQSYRVEEALRVHNLLLLKLSLLLSLSSLHLLILLLFLLLVDVDHSG